MVALALQTYSELEQIICMLISGIHRQKHSHHKSPTQNGTHERDFVFTMTAILVSTDTKFKNINSALLIIRACTHIQ